MKYPAHASLLPPIVSRITQSSIPQGAPVSIVVPSRDRSRWLPLATIPFVVGAVMGCTHSLVAALLLITLQLVLLINRRHPMTA